MGPHVRIPNAPLPPEHAHNEGATQSRVLSLVIRTVLQTPANIKAVLLIDAPKPMINRRKIIEERSKSQTGQGGSMALAGAQVKAEGPGLP